MVEIAIQTSAGLSKQPSSKKGVKTIPKSTRNNGDKNFYNIHGFKQIGVGTTNSENGGSGIKSSRNSSRVGTIKSQRSLKKKLSSGAKSSKSKISLKSVEEHKYPTANTADHLPLSGSNLPQPIENNTHNDYIKI